jgi:hypothetical protein
MGPIPEAALELAGTVRVTFAIWVATLLKSTTAPFSELLVSIEQAALEDAAEQVRKT